MDYFSEMHFSFIKKMKQLNVVIPLLIRSFHCKIYIYIFICIHIHMLPLLLTIENTLIRLTLRFISGLIFLALIVTYVTILRFQLTSRLTKLTPQFYQPL